MRAKFIVLPVVLCFSVQPVMADELSMFGAAASSVFHAREKRKEHHDFHPLTSIAVVTVVSTIAIGTKLCSTPRYRDDERCAAGRELVGINGHPTDLIYEKSNTLKLRKNLLAAGEPSAKGCAAHHIVAQEDKRKSAADSREILDQCNIDIDDAINGVHLPHNKNAECAGANHRTLHTDNYYDYVVGVLKVALFSGCGSVKDNLSDIKTDLLNNNKPWEQ